MKNFKNSLIICFLLLVFISPVYIHLKMSGHSEWKDTSLIVFTVIQFLGIIILSIILKSNKKTQGELQKSQNKYQMLFDNHIRKLNTKSFHYVNI